MGENFNLGNEIPLKKTENIEGQEKLGLYDFGALAKKTAHEVESGTKTAIKLDELRPPNPVLEGLSPEIAQEVESNVNNTRIKVELFNSLEQKYSLSSAKNLLDNINSLNNNIFNTLHEKIGGDESMLKRASLFLGNGILSMWLYKKGNTVLHEIGHERVFSGYGVDSNIYLGNEAMNRGNSIYELLFKQISSHYRAFVSPNKTMLESTGFYSIETIENPECAGIEESYIYEGEEICSIPSTGEDGTEYGGYYRNIESYKQTDKSSHVVGTGINNNTDYSNDFYRENVKNGNVHAMDITGYIASKLVGLTYFDSSLDGKDESGDPIKYIEGLNERGIDISVEKVHKYMLLSTLLSGGTLNTINASFGYLKDGDTRSNVMGFTIGDQHVSLPEFNIFLRKNGVSGKVSITTKSTKDYSGYYGDIEKSINGDTPTELTIGKYWNTDVTSFDIGATMNNNGGVGLKAEVTHLIKNDFGIYTEAIYNNGLTNDGSGKEIGQIIGGITFYF